MHTRRIFLALSLAASAVSVAFADYQSLNQPEQSQDRLEQLSRTLSQGSYAEVDSIEMLANTVIEQKIEDKAATVLNNESLSKKYTQNYTARDSGLSWLKTHPLPNARVSSNYGGRTMSGRAENHSGLDLAAPTGTPIYATGPGIVTKAGWGTGYGQYVEINHGNGYLTRYAHASRLNVRVGDNVTAGDHIANVGCTGRCTGPHLHYEVVKDGKRKNPSTYLAMLP